MILYRMMSKEEAQATVARPVWITRYKWFCPDLATLQQKIRSFASAKVSPDKYAYTMKFTIPDEDVKFFTRLNSHEYMLDRRVAHNVHFLSAQMVSDTGAEFSKQAATYTVNVGDPVLFGRWRNHHGIITGLGEDSKGNPTVTVTPVPQGRKQPKEFQLFKIWQDPPPAMQAQNQVEKVAARYTGDFGMAVTTTLVFSDEAHRESWLRMNGVLDHPDPEIAEAKELDYQRRQNDQNLIYMAPNIRESCDRVASRYLEARSLKDWAFWMAQPFQVIWKHHQEFVQGPVDDAMDAIIKELAPRLVKYLVKHEVDEDVDEFIAGANLALKGAPMPSEDSKKDGYIWGKAHPDDVISNDLPPMIKRQFIQDALNEVSHKITEEVVLHTLRKAWEAINPVNTFKAIWAAVKKHGWKLGVAAALFELFEHFLFPSILVWITGKPELLASASIPFGEIVYAIIFRILGRTPKELDKVEPEGHLDWFEKNYGPVRIATSTELKYPRKSVLLETPLVTFYVVDGKAIRDDPQFSTCINVPADGPEPFDFTDFTTGANNGRYPWVPGSEIWIDNTVPPDEQRPTMIHELHEYGHMLNGWSYDKAHDAANKHEHAVRDDPSRFRFELLSGLRRLREALA